MIDRCVDAARLYLDAHFDERVTLSDLAKRTGVSAFHLQRAFKARVGLSPKAYLDARRVELFKARAREGATVSEAIYEAGFSSPRALYERADAALGMTPATYRRGGEGMEIDYTIVPCSLGSMLVAVTCVGVCAVLLASGKLALERELRREFPNARRTRNDEQLTPFVRAVVAILDGRSEKAVPLDLRGTDFQRRVWTALQAIPRGETRSYREIAKALGIPSSTRAVGGAIAANKLAVLIPCHRVLREGGAIGGYRWGVARKQELLRKERSKRSR